jgi:hypothetical protein
LKRGQAKSVKYLKQKNKFASVVNPTLFTKVLTLRMFVNLVIEKIKRRENKKKLRAETSRSLLLLGHKERISLSLVFGRGRDLEVSTPYWIFQLHSKKPR